MSKHKKIKNQEVLCESNSRRNSSAIDHNYDTVGHDQICYYNMQTKQEEWHIEAIDTPGLHSSSYHHLLQPLQHNSSEITLYLTL